MLHLYLSKLVRVKAAGTTASDIIALRLTCPTILANAKAVLSSYLVDPGTGSSPSID